MPVTTTKGAASAQGYGEFTASAPKVYIEDVFSTYLYAGTGSAQTITNGIDLSTKGGLVWTKPRNTSSTSNSHILTDTARGAYKQLFTNTTGAQYDPGPYGVSFASSGFSLTASDVGSNSSADTYASWTFRKQPKFFDVVTFTSNGSGGGTFSHSLGSTPGCVIIKSTSAANSWLVYHRSTGVSKYLELQSTAAEQTGTNWISVSSTSVTVDSGWLGNNRSMVAYLFAHDAGGFGLSGTDNVISCGSFSGAGTIVNLGWEPQWILAKRTDTTGNWYIDDNMRGWPAAPQNDNPLLANSSSAEPAGYAGFANITSTGFTNNFNGDYIYIAIRRGPMKVPTSGTSVFEPITYTGNATDGTVRTTGIVTDMVWSSARSGGGVADYDRLRGAARILNTYSAGQEQPESGTAIGLKGFDLQNGYYAGADQGSGQINFSGLNYVNWAFRRAPGFFDVVCYTGTGANRTVAHNLGVVPELMIVKRRDTTGSWITYWQSLGATKYQVISTATPGTLSTVWNDTAPTSSVFTVGTDASLNASSGTYVAYLFATLAGVSKVGSYTGTAATLQIDCGFTGGARFILIKRTDSTGDWYVYDSARGIVAGNDPYLFLNSTAAEVTNTDYVDTYSAGFELSSTAPAGLNANGGTYIFLAIA